MENPISISFRWLDEESCCSLCLEISVEGILRKTLHILTIGFDTNGLSLKQRIFSLMPTDCLSSTLSNMLITSKEGLKLYNTRLEAQKAIEEYLIWYDVHKFLANPVIGKQESQRSMRNKLSDLGDLIL